MDTNTDTAQISRCHFLVANVQNMLEQIEHDLLLQEVSPHTNDFVSNSVCVIMIEMQQNRKYSLLNNFQIWVYIATALYSSVP